VNKSIFHSNRLVFLAAESPDDPVQTAKKEIGAIADRETNDFDNRLKMMSDEEKVKLDYITLGNDAKNKIISAYTHYSLLLPDGSPQKNELHVFLTQKFNVLDEKIKLYTENVKKLQEIASANAKCQEQFNKCKDQCGISADAFRDLIMSDPTKMTDQQISHWEKITFPSYASMYNSALIQAKDEFAKAKPLVENNASDMAIALKADLDSWETQVAGFEEKIVTMEGRTFSFITALKLRASANYLSSTTPAEAHKRAQQAKADIDQARSGVEDFAIIKPTVGQRPKATDVPSA